MATTISIRINQNITMILVLSVECSKIDRKKLTITWTLLNTVTEIIVTVCSCCKVP